MSAPSLPARVGVLGSGQVGRVLAAGFQSHGVDAVLGTRRTGDAELTAWSQASTVPVVSFEDATAFGDTVVIAVRGAAEAVGGLIDGAGGPEAFAGKTVIDATNPLVFGEAGPALEEAEGSGGERLQRRLSDAHVVKAFNTVGNAQMVDPQLPGGPPVMFIAGNDEDAVGVTGAILEAFGWRWRNVGGIERSRELEELCILWVAIGARSGSWDHAFTLLEP